MKNSITTTVLLKAIDIELRKILKEDLEKYKKARERNNNLAFVKQLLAA